MSTSLKIEVEESIANRIVCCKCRTIKVEDIPLDSEYRLQCNLCYKHEKEKWRLNWMQVKKKELECCQLCWDAYWRKKKVSVHKCPRVGVYQCVRCACQFNSVKSLNAHLKVSHDRLDSDEAQSSWVGRHVSTAVRRFSCTICNKEFSKLQHLEVHSRTHTGEKPFSCIFCEKMFSQSGSLSYHLRIHTREKPYPCEFCNKAFSSALSLRIHIRSHTGERPYECKICKKEFSQSGILKKHLKCHTGEKPFECELCHERFKLPGALRNHSYTHVRMF